MTCRTCKYLAVEADGNGKRVPRKHRVYRCDVIVEQPKLPASMTKTHDFHWPLVRSFMEPDEGNDCPFYEKLNR